MPTKILIVCLALGTIGAAQAADEVKRTYTYPEQPIAQTVTVPAGYDTVYISGIMADLPTPPAPAPSMEVQSANVFDKIHALLKEQGVTESDVVAMTVYMLAPQGARMDINGMQSGYRRYYGSKDQPNRPVRAVIQVAGLARVGALLEVQVTARHKPR